MQLQRFLGSLNYVAEFIPNLSVLCKPLHDRLKKNPPPWIEEYSNIVKRIKEQVKELPCLHLADPTAFKIIETDAFDIGYDGILKQRKDEKEQVIQFTSKHWNSIQQNYSTIKKKILARVLCIQNFKVIC